MKKILTFLTIILISGCMSVTKEDLDGSIGTSYRQATSSSKFGEFMGSESLSDGSQIMKHIKRLHQKDSGMGFGDFSFGKKTQYYDVVYFKVKNDIIKDWAKTRYSDKGKYFGMNNIFEVNNTTTDPKLLSELDALVRTSKGQPISSWK